KTSGEAYENSTPNTLALIGTDEVLKYFMELGVKNIFDHIIDIQDKFIELLDKTKFRIESDLSAEHRSNILIFSHVDITKNKEVQKMLEEPMDKHTILNVKYPYCSKGRLPEGFTAYIQ
ncbi:MAG TPA: aminotransferase class V-fold PLP-dependent enzyme, partial [Ignavibacteria bacterium]|nr:aminotransferase class V-fold PLP-dependent enzyme [Ignavibacteria bacterium]